MPVGDETRSGSNRTIVIGLLFLLACDAASPEAPCQPGDICTVVGTGDNGYDEGGDERAVPALETTLSLPQDILTVPGEGMLFLDWNNHRLRRLDDDGKVRWVAGTGDLGGSLDDPASGSLNHPPSMTLTPAGDALIIADWHGSRLWELDLQTGAMRIIAGTGERAYRGDGGPAEECAFDLPVSVAFDERGELLVLDQVNQVIRRIARDGRIRRIAGNCVIDRDAYGPASCEDLEPCPDSDKLTCLGTEACRLPCTPAFSGDGGPAVDMRMAQPVGAAAYPIGRLAVDFRGYIFFSDPSNHMIRRIGTDGVVHHVAGREFADEFPGGGYGGDGGFAEYALLNSPGDLAFARDGTLYFTDTMNHCVRAISLRGEIWSVAGTCGESGFAGDGGPANEALLNRPFGLEWFDGTLNIADTGNNRIRRVVLE